MYAWSSPPMYTFGSGNRGDDLKGNTNYHTPGPGNYDQVPQDTTKKGYPSWKVGTSQRPTLYTSSNTQTGPGSYDHAQKEPKKFSKKTFPKATRGQSSEYKGTAAVGPGSYDAKTFVGVGKNYTFGYKSDGFECGNKSGAPGPGAYDIKDPIAELAAKTQRVGDAKSAFTRTAPQHMSHSKDDRNNPSNQPGPGEHYNADIDNYDFRYFTPTWSFGKSTRDGLYSDGLHPIPGPGKYNINGTIKNRGGFTILGKHQIKAASSDAPGPNVYNPDISPLRQTAPCFRIGKAVRKDLSNPNSEIPGPGAYYKDPGQPTKGAKIGTSVRPMLYSSDGGKNPGPGEYDIKGTCGYTSKYSMGVKSNPKKMTEVMPGPGEYEPFGTLYLEKTNGAIIGTSERPGLYKKATAPGPGQYDVRGNIGTGTKSKIGQGRRVPLMKVNDEPGPGFYNIPSSIGNVPKYLLPNYAQERKRAATSQDSSFKGIFA